MIIKPKVKLVKANGEEVWIFGTKEEGRSTPDVGKNTENIYKPKTSTKMSPMTPTTPAKSIFRFKIYFLQILIWR
jgi:hypothetical protein